MPRTCVPATKCDAYVPHHARTVLLACRVGNVPRTIAIWEEIQNRLHGIFKSRRNFEEFHIKYGLLLPQYTVYPDLNLETKLFFLAQNNINDHFVIQSGPTSELAVKKSSIKSIITTNKIVRSLRRIFL